MTHKPNICKFPITRQSSKHPGNTSYKKLVFQVSVETSNIPSFSVRQDPRLLKLHHNTFKGIKISHFQFIFNFLSISFTVF